MNIWILTKLSNTGLGYNCDVVDVFTDENDAIATLKIVAQEFIDDFEIETSDILCNDNKCVEIERREPSSNYVHTKFQIEQKDCKDNYVDDNNFETLGAHIRNSLGPYANIVHMLEEMHNAETDEETKSLLKDYLLNKIEPEELRKNLEHFIEVSKLEEVEIINWRKTKLFEDYVKTKK